MPRGAKTSQEEDAFLQGFSSSVTKKSTIGFYFVALIVATTPIYLYYGIHQMDINESWIVWAVSVVASAGLLGTAYSNTKQGLKDQIIAKRGEAVAREVSKELADDRKMSKTEKDQRILWKKSEVGDNESTAVAIFFNNAVFYALFLVFSFFLFANISAIYNCLISLIGAGGLVFFFSTAK